MRPVDYSRLPALWPLIQTPAQELRISPNFYLVFKSFYFKFSRKFHSTSIQRKTPLQSMKYLHGHIYKHNFVHCAAGYIIFAMRYLEDDLRHSLVSEIKRRKGNAHIFHFLHIAQRISVDKLHDNQMAGYINWLRYWEFMIIQGYK